MKTGVYPGESRGRNDIAIMPGIFFKKLGNVQAANVVLVGAFSNFFPDMKEERFIDAIKNLLVPKLQDLNVKAFYEGRKAL